jgi:hypothetical protein
VVVALAVLHHLILTQRFHPRDIVREIAKYTRRYVVMEFMPLGRWTEKKSKPSPPWYTTDWFRSYFTEVFDLMLEEDVAPSRGGRGQISARSPAPLRLIAPSPAPAISSPSTSARTRSPAGRATASRSRPDRERPTLSGEPSRCE